MTGEPFCNSRWMENLSRSGKIQTSSKGNLVSTGMQYSDAAKASRKGRTGTSGNLKINDGCQSNFSHTT